MRSQPSAVNQSSPTTKPSSRAVNGPSQTNGTVPLSSRVSHVSSKVSAIGKDGKTQEKQPVKQQSKDEKSKDEKVKTEEKQPVKKETTNNDKDKELARLRLQNAQMKVTLENKANK